jgi:hypothetical protein
MTDLVLVKASSRRAAHKLKALVGDEIQAVFSITRSTGRGAYRIPAQFEQDAKSITGIGGMREGSDLHQVWETGKTVCALRREGTDD